MAILQSSLNIMSPNYPLKNLQELIDYWDTWHYEWQKIFSINPISMPKDIFGWEVPVFNGSTSKTPSYMYFPEPYWGNVNLGKIKRVFINLNPGQGNINQHINSLANGLSLGQYSNIVSQLAINSQYITTSKFFIPKRINWVNNNLTPTNSLTLNDYLGVDLIPWHTVTFGSKESNYAKNHIDFIYNKVLSPILNLTPNVDIIGQGNKIKTILSMSFSSRAWGNVEIFPNSSNNIVIFKGTQGMYLPTNKALLSSLKIK